MAKFLWTAKDRSGWPVATEIHADTIEQAKVSLLAEGYTDLILRGDEILDESEKSFGEDPKIFGEKVVITPEQRLKFRSQPPPTFFRALRDSVLESKGLFLVQALLIAWFLYREHYVAAGIIGALMIAWPIFRVWLSLPGIHYRKLIKAREWHRWDEVLAIVERCEKLNRRHVIKLPAPELANSRAKAIAGKGNIEQAIAELQRFENHPGMPSWLFKANLAALYDNVHQPDRAIELTRQAIAEKPTPTLHLDLANRLLKDKHDVAGGRAALAAAEKETLVDIAKPFQHRCRGMLAYLEGDNAAAKRELEAALEIWNGAPHQPFRDANLSLTKGWLCSVMARQGEMAGARKHFSEAEEYLIAVEETRLLQQCRNLLGQI